MQISIKLKKFLRSLLGYLLVFIVIYNVVNWWRQPIMPANPTLQFDDIAGNTIDLANLSKEKPVLVYFWGSWCAICRQTSPIINKLAQSNHYPVVTIAVNSGSNADVQQYLNQHQWQFVTVNDSDGQVFQAWQGQVTPSYVILENGEMKQGFTGIHFAWELTLRLWLLKNF